MKTDPILDWQDLDIEKWKERSTDGWLETRWHKDPKIQSKLIQVVKDCQMARSSGSVAMAFLQDFVEAIGLGKDPPFFKGQIDMSQPPILMPRFIWDIKRPGEILKKAFRKYIKFSQNLSKAIDRVSDKGRFRVHFNDSSQILAANSLFRADSNFRARWEERGIKFPENPVTDHFKDPKSYGHVGWDVKFEVLINGRWLTCELQLLHEQMLMTDALTHKTFETDRNVRSDAAGSALTGEQTISSESFRESLMDQYIGDLVRLRLYEDLVGAKYLNPDAKFLKELERRCQQEETDETKKKTKMSSQDEYKEYLRYMLKLNEAVARAELKNTTSEEIRQKIAERYRRTSTLLKSEQERFMDDDMRLLTGIDMTPRRANSSKLSQGVIVVPPSEPAITTESRSEKGREPS